MTHEDITLIAWMGFFAMGAFMVLMALFGDSFNDDKEEEE